MLAVTSYDISLFLHITAVVIGLGSTFVEGLTFPVAMRPDRRHLPYKHRLQLAIHQFLSLPALVIVLATGLYQVEDLDLDLGDFLEQIEARDPGPVPAQERGRVFSVS